MLLFSELASSLPLASQIRHSWQWEFAFGRVYSEMQEKWVSGSRVNGFLEAVLDLRLYCVVHESRV
ncbi:hypothetical protein TNIN_462081, partial [Trichonephila inaurata madagascariensis]